MNEVFVYLIVIVGATCVTFITAPGWRPAAVFAAAGIAFLALTSVLALLGSYTLTDLGGVFLLQIRAQRDSLGLVQLAAVGHAFLLAALLVATRRLLSASSSHRD
jgi:hypothetical protein